ncbi:MAG: ATP-binding protein [Candidatus Hydrothermarchaeota archaeon]|nr:ATP-binding protein [Candidatus Hydrothermarchaeota archaeon]
MIQQFVNRNAELEFLERKYAESSAQMIILYGRRRVGKTELIKRFIQKKKALYFLCTRDSLSENSKELKRKFYEFTGKEYFLKLETSSFFDLMKYLIEEIKNEKLIIVFDEFPYLIELDRGITSVFQKMWDELLRDKRVFLILSGSSVGMMETEVLGSKSPLYGRRTGDWKVEPFTFTDVAKMFYGFSMEDCVKLWSVLGGTPFYLSQVKPKLSVEENIRGKILKKGEILYSEPKILLKEEFREPKTYTLILKYLSLGYNSQGELSSVTGIEKGNLSKYLSVLEETHLLKYVLPLGQRKRGVYVIGDPFFNFWFRFVYPNLSDLEIGLVREVFNRIKSQLNPYYGLMFEQLVFDLIRARCLRFPFEFDDVRKWWHKDKEIDVVALNERTKQILFAECKWQDDVDAGRIFAELKEKSQHVNWNKGERKEYFAIFAKSFRKRVEEPGLKLFDLKDMRYLFLHV